MEGTSWARISLLRGQPGPNAESRSGAPATPANAGPRQSRCMPNPERAGKTCRVDRLCTAEKFLQQPLCIFGVIAKGARAVNRSQRESRYEMQFQMRLLRGGSFSNRARLGGGSFDYDNRTAGHAVVGYETSRELSGFTRLPPELLGWKEVALSGDGEPTLSAQFREIVHEVVALRSRRSAQFFAVQGEVQTWRNRNLRERASTEP